jgi:phosphoglycolate phosphatase-like HAD superfamily hydrolase
LPKPDPDGLLQLARAWGIAPAQMVMVGDYRFDLDCGRAAGAHTVLVNLPENPWPELADWHALDCHALSRLIEA